MLRRCSRGSTIEQDDNVAGGAERYFEQPCGIVENTEHADDRRRINRTAERFVVEADVAAGDRCTEGVARFGDAVDGFTELPHHFGFFRTAEIEAIGGSDGSC